MYSSVKAAFSKIHVPRVMKGSLEKLKGTRAPEPSREPLIGAADGVPAKAEQPSPAELAGESCAIHAGLLECRFSATPLLEKAGLLGNYTEALTKLGEVLAQETQSSVDRFLFGHSHRSKALSTHNSLVTLRNELCLRDMESPLSGLDALQRAALQDIRTSHNALVGAYHSGGKAKYSRLEPDRLALRSLSQRIETLASGTGMVFSGEAQADLWPDIFEESAANAHARELPRMPIRRAGGYSHASHMDIGF